jgi:hypothetical protein
MGISILISGESVMNEALKTLRNHLKSLKNLPSAEKYEAMLVWSKVNLELYQQEKDKEGSDLFSEVVKLVESAESLEDLEKKVA